MELPDDRAFESAVSEFVRNDSCRELFEEGNVLALFWCIISCSEEDRPVPNWARDALASRFKAYRNPNISLEKAMFGPARLGRHADPRREVAEKQAKVHKLAAVVAAEAEGHRGDAKFDRAQKLASELVRQRPDILAAEAQLHSASAQIGVATAAMFPQITLSGTYGSSTTSISELFSGPAAAWAIGGQLVTPIFHAGALWFQRRAAIEGYNQSAATYRQTVLAGLAQVADALGALQHDATMVSAQSRQETAAHDALRVIDVNYEAGLANYLDVLIADIQYNQAIITRIGGEAQRLQDTVALFVALGGGWWDAQDRILHPTGTAMSAQPGGNRSRPS
jgi:hypothetical protein